MVYKLGLIGHMKIDNFKIGSKKTFVIAEIGNNHNGNLELAYDLIDDAIEIGVDCVKFQMRNLNEVYRKKSLTKSGDDLGSEYIIDLLNRFELTLEEHKKLFDYCLEKGITYLCTPWDTKSVDVLEDFGVKGYKVASADLTNIPLLKRLILTNKPLILSTGMNSVDEVLKTVSFLKKSNVYFALLHCNSTYPAPFQDINLNWIKSLEKIHHLVGYSGHERGISVSIAAVALGAKIIERHLTKDRDMEGPDHAASLEVKEFKLLVESIREVEESLGQGLERKISQGELINRENLGKSIVAAKKLNIGHIITKDDIKIVSPGQGLSPQKIDELLGKKLQRNLEYEDFFFQTDIVGKKNYKNTFDFKLKWGIPVRYHDFEKFNNLIKPDIFEFHLSYSDMEIKLEKFMNNKYDMGFVVHAPELFRKSHLMDLATTDSSYSKISLNETQRVINITKDLNKYFPKQKNPLIVANIGGFSMDSPIDESRKELLYETFFKNLSKLNTEGVEIIPQTMAPFPWHFGGQRYQNLFVHIDEIVYYCEKFNIRMCFDVSHSMLTCNHFGQDFYKFSEKIAPYTAHIHLGDASGVNGEGLQIGEGEIDFVKLGSILREKSPTSSFIPEIWQGHKNDGEGFFKALEKLENLF